MEQYHFFVIVSATKYINLIKIVRVKTFYSTVVTYLGLLITYLRPIYQRLRRSDYVSWTGLKGLIITDIWTLQTY